MVYTSFGYTSSAEISFGGGNNSTGGIIYKLLLGGVYKLWLVVYTQTRRKTRLALKLIIYVALYTSFG